jgi:hypothetical protein
MLSRLAILQSFRRCSAEISLPSTQFFADDKKNTNIQTKLQKPHAIMSGFRETRYAAPAQSKRENPETNLQILRKTIFTGEPFVNVFSTQRGRAANK